MHQISRARDAHAGASIKPTLQAQVSSSKCVDSKTSRKAAKMTAGLPAACVHAITVVIMQKQVIPSAFV